MNELCRALEEYLAIRRQLGFKLSGEGHFLPQFIRFLEREGAAFVTRDLALSWATQPQNTLPAWWAERLRMVRRFAQYLSTVDPRTEIPPAGLLPYRYHRKSPYIYSDEEIAQLIDAAQKLPSAVGLRPRTYSTLFGLLAVTGMRIREPIHLDRGDVDLARGMLTIHQTKFGKSRLVAIHPSTRGILQVYEKRRNRIFPNPYDGSFFISDKGIRLTDDSVRWTFVKLSRQIGLRCPGDSHGPRLHDFRHRFAVHTLLNWYRTGANIEQQMPKLAAYLGHTHVNDTYWYLSAVPELTELATMRLRETKGGKWL
ncbi:MAG: tyrosine-type recombinase/integrase [Proteobacteria bacterium]|nr:tyrosine-type recombinase/integrase [Pseudomonadota bacterium]